MRAGRKRGNGVRASETLHTNREKLTSMASWEMTAVPAPDSFTSCMVAASGSKPSGQAQTNSKGRRAANRSQECVMLFPSPTYTICKQHPCFSCSLGWTNPSTSQLKACRLLMACCGVNNIPVCFAGQSKKSMPLLAPVDGLYLWCHESAPCDMGLHSGVFQRLTGMVTSIDPGRFTADSDR